MKLNLGAGQDIIEGWVNHDIVSIKGVDIVHNLNIIPWPWASDSIDEIKLYDVLEHLDDFMLAIQEVWRILKPGGRVYVSVPYYNSWSFAADPTHKKGFHELTFRFFDPSSSYCKDRSYYTNVRFHIENECFMLSLFNPYVIIPFLGSIRVSSRVGKFLIGLVGNYFISNLIQDLRLELIKTN